MNSPAPSDSSWAELPVICVAALAKAIVWSNFVTHIVGVTQILRFFKAQMSLNCQDTVSGCEAKMHLNQQ